jgi:hypothetical protein
MFDMMKIKKTMKEGWTVLDRTFKINPTFEECCEALDRYNGSANVAVDIETDMGANYIKCVGFADSRDYATCIPFYEGGRAVWTEKQETFLWKQVRDILTNPKVGKIIQNMMFEMTVLYPWVGEIYPIIMDTAVAHHCLLSELKKNLGLQASIYTSEPFFKDDPGLRGFLQRPEVGIAYRRYLLFQFVKRFSVKQCLGFSLFISIYDIYRDNFFIVFHLCDYNGIYNLFRNFNLDWGTH